MAEGTREAKNVSCDGILEPASPSLQNCIKFSNSGSYFSVLCDFGVVCVCDLKDTGASFRAVVVKKLAFDKGEVLEGHAWSSDDQVFAVAGCKIYLFQVSKGFSSLHTIPLYYMPKDISLIVRDSSSVYKMYTLAVAGPNGVEFYQMEIGDTLSMVETSSLHSDLAIALVQFSPDKHYLALAALDGHFGIWTVSSLDTDHKEFWYVHLKTVRITSMEFSPDSSMVAVAGWEGSWHSYRKTVQNERTWIEFHHGKSPDRVSGDLPGSFISWSPDNRFIRLTRYKESKVCLSTFDTQTLITTVTPLAGIVKGIASFRGPSVNYSLCFMRSKQCFAVPWPSDKAVPVKTTAAPKQTTQLFFQESFEGSVLVELSTEGGVTLRWRRTSQENLELLREISKTRSDITDVIQLSDVQQCIPMSKSKSVGCDQDGLSKAQAGDSIKSNADCTHGKTNEICIKSTEDSDKSGELNSDIVGKGVQALEIKEIIINGHTSLKEEEPRTCELSEDNHAVGCLEGSSQNTSQRGNMVSMLERDESVCASLGSCQTSQGSPINECHPKAPDVAGHTSRVANGVCSIQAPFLNPRLFQIACSESSPLLSGSSVQLLNSTNYVIVVILPLLAYVYHHTNEEWKTLLFPCAVKCCCITEGKYLALLTNDGRVKIWCLESMETLYSSHEGLCGTDSGLQRCMMSGNPYKPQFIIIKQDKVGTREILRINFQPNHGDTRLTANRFPVCYPDLLSHSCSNQLCGSVDHLIIFKQSHSEGRAQTNLSQKWVVIVPELCISQTFLEERECSLEAFVTRHHSALCKLNALSVSNR